MSPTSTAHNRRTIRKIAMCAAALAVTVLPTACGGAAYAGGTKPGHAGHTSEVVEVGGVDAAGVAADDEDGAAAEDAPEEDAAAGDDAEGGAAEGGEAEGAAAEDEAAPAEGNGNGNGQDNAQENGQENGQGNEGNNGQGNANGQGQGNNAQGQGNQNNNGLDVLGTDCTNSNLEPHNGLQQAPRCVDTSFGEVASEDKSPSLLITEAPQSVPAEQQFTISVSTRNLVRDRFLGAADGGYYLESSFLNGDGIQRGHFHTACRMLEELDAAPNAEPAPEFFLATQDNGGGAAPDTVKITVTGMPRGTAQCAVWAGDGSHRIPMMQRANQTPAFDAVRITVE